jgi:hypothetical protein
MSYTTGLEMILDIERELRTRSTAHSWATRRPRQQGLRHNLRALRAALEAFARRARTTRLATAAPAGSTTAPCCA